MSIRQSLNIARHNQLLDAPHTANKLRQAGAAVQTASGGNSRLDVFCATAKRDACLGQYYGAQASRAPQAAFGVGQASAFSEAILAQVQGENALVEEIIYGAEQRPFAGLFNHLVSGVTVAGSMVAGAVSGVALGVLGGAALGAVGLISNWRTSHRSALHGVRLGAGAGFHLVGGGILLAGTGAINRGLAYCSGAITLATRAAGHVVGGVLFGVAGVVHGAVAAMLHAPAPREHDLPAPRRAPPDFAFA